MHFDRHEQVACLCLYNCAVLTGVWIIGDCCAALNCTGCREGGSVRLGIMPKCVGRILLVGVQGSQSILLSVQTTAEL